jgi:hypothetical protein
VANPRNLVHALYRHWDVVERIVRLTREMPVFEREQLLALVRQTRPNAEPEEAEVVLQQLVSADLLQLLPRTNGLQVNALALEFVRGLTKEHELGLSEVLRARVDAIKDATAALAAALESGDRDLRRRAANQLSELVRQIMQQLEQDQSAIQLLAEEAKSATDGMPIKRRYQRVLEAYDKYVAPMTEMMDTGIEGAFYRHLEQAEQVLDRAVHTLSVEGSLYTQQRTMRQVAYQAKALRSQGRQVLKSCTDTLLPLREEVRQHNTLSTSISLLLGQVRKKGLARALPRASLPFWQRERASRLSVGSEVLTIMAEARRFQPGRMRFPEEAESAADTFIELVDEANLMQHLQASLPVHDLLGWLRTYYSHYSDSTLLRLYNDLITHDRWLVQPRPEATSLALQEVRVTFHPHGVSENG